MPVYEKNRYITLDGQNIREDGKLEHWLGYQLRDPGNWLVGTVSAARGAMYDESLFDPISFAAAAAIGTFFKETIRRKNNDLLKSAFGGAAAFDSLCIDTRPDKGAAQDLHYRIIAEVLHRTLRQDVSPMIKRTAPALMAVIYPLSYFFLMADRPLLDASLHTSAVLSGPLAENARCIHRFRQVARDKWHIIDRAAIKKQPEKAPASAPALPAPA